MFGIITAVDNERDSVLDKMTDIKTIVLYNIVFYQGFIHHTPCITAMSGVGKVNAARCSQLMIDRFQPDRIVNLGSAGAIHPDINVGDVVISTACIQHDVDLTVFGIKRGAFNERDCGFFQADPDFAGLCQKAIANSIGNEFKIFSGVIATGDQFNDSIEKKSQLFDEFGAHCNEMEGAAVAQVCALCNIPFVVIRSISDTPGNESKMLYNDYKQLASERCADFLVNLIAIIENCDSKLTI
ncbi:MAG: 5'-methylthioadenosine/adenosylhomocysteine nucleosidase [Firmicutes bacterium]|nr:5'-methylthioadenosine/adenosylhomocysteine nucleosidase [Bacillota bacterium]